MATGASTCDLAIILVDARRGVQTQTKRHSFIVSLLGIKHIIVAVNKMDLVDYSQARFDRAGLERHQWASRIDDPVAVENPFEAAMRIRVRRHSNAQRDPVPQRQALAQRQQCARMARTRRQPRVEQVATKPTWHVDGPVDRATIQVNLRPIPFELVDELADEGFYDPAAVKARVPTFTVESTRLEWTIDTAEMTVFESMCVQSANCFDVIANEPRE